MRKANEARMKLFQTNLLTRVMKKNNQNDQKFNRVQRKIDFAQQDRSYPTGEKHEEGNIF